LAFLHPHSRTSKDIGIGKRTTSAAALELEQLETSPYKFSVERNLPEISSAAGTAHLAQSNLLPILEDLAMFSVDLTHQGMRELHWHPEISEMGYVANGRGRMTIVSPGSSVDTFEMLSWRRLLHSSSLSSSLRRSGRR
jgi:oxalate decarboxylase